MQAGVLLKVRSQQGDPVTTCRMKKRDDLEE
jgi:hypothetical protein